MLAGPAAEQQPDESVAPDPRIAPAFGSVAVHKVRQLDKPDIDRIAVVPDTVHFAGNHRAAQAPHNPKHRHDMADIHMVADNSRHTSYDGYHKDFHEVDVLVHVARVPIPF
jgi:hypothetical protein